MGELWVFYSANTFVAVLIVEKKYLTAATKGRKDYLAHDLRRDADHHDAENMAAGRWLITLHPKEK